MTVSTWEVCIPSREQTWRVQALRVAELLWRIGSRSDELFVSYSFPVSCLESWCVSFTWRQDDWIWCTVTESYAKSHNFYEFLEVLRSFEKTFSRETSADLGRVMSLRRHHWRSESRLDTGVCLESWKCPSWSYLLGIEGQEVLHWLGGRTSNQFKWLGVVKFMVIVRATVIITVLILLRITNIAILIASILVYISSFSASLLGWTKHTRTSHINLFSIT